MISLGGLLVYQLEIKILFRTLDSVESGYHLTLYWLFSLFSGDEKNWQHPKRL